MSTQFFKQPFTAARMTRIAAVAALYAVCTICISPLSYGQVQFRLSEILVLLAFFHPDYGIGLTIGCAVANLFSPLAALDVPIGTAATVLAVLCIYKSRHIGVAALFPVLFNGLLVGAELSLFYHIPFWATAAGVAAGELAVVVCIGVPCFRLLSRNPLFLRAVRPVPHKQHVRI